MNNGSTVWRLSKSQIDRELSENANIIEIKDRKMEDSCCWLLAVVVILIYPVDVLFILIFVLILRV